MLFALQAYCQIKSPRHRGLFVCKLFEHALFLGEVLCFALTFRYNRLSALGMLR